MTVEELIALKVAQYDRRRAEVIAELDRDRARLEWVARSAGVGLPVLPGFGQGVIAEDAEATALLDRLLMRFAAMRPRSEDRPVGLILSVAGDNVIGDVDAGLEAGLIAFIRRRIDQTTGEDQRRLRAILVLG